MTAQVPDTISFRDLVFTISGIRGTRLFEPMQHGFSPIAKSTATRRGYACRYAIVNGRLQLDGFRVDLDGQPPAFLGVLPSAPTGGYSFDAEYHGLGLEVAFDGGLLAGRDFIQALYAHMGFHPAWKFRIVHQFNFENGVLLQETDRSAEAERFRKKVAKNPNLARTSIGETFALDFDVWAA